ncbi:MAG: TonB family protein [Acidobacteriota bacterium]
MNDFEAPLKGAFAKSLTMHMLAILALSGYAWWHQVGASFGDPNAGGPAVAVKMVATIPLPSKGPENPVANDTNSEIPQTPPEKIAPKAVKEPDPPDAVAILPPEKQKKQPALPKLQSFKNIAQNQVKSTTPQAASNPMFQQKTGGGDTKTFGDAPLGSQFPEYSASVIDIAQRSWRTNDVDQSIRSAPQVRVNFTLMRDGKTQKVNLIQKSGVPTLDYSVIRAIEEAHFPPFPAGYDKASVTVNLTFELAR